MTHQLSNTRLSNALLLATLAIGVNIHLLDEARLHAQRFAAMGPNNTVFPRAIFQPGLFIDLHLVWVMAVAGAAAFLLARPALPRWRGVYGPLAVGLMAVPALNLLPLALLWVECLVRRFASAAPPPATGVPAGPVVPRIRTQAFVEAAAALPGMTQQNMPLVGEIAGDLVVSFAIDTGDSFVTLTGQLCALRGLEPDQVLPLAMRNIVPALRSLTTREEGPVCHIGGAGDDNNMAACVLLNAAVWDAATVRLGDAPVAIVPHRKAVHYTAAGSVEGLAALRRILAATDFSQGHALSQQMYLWRQGQWSVFAG